MSNVEIIALIVTIICLISFCLVFTFLFRHYYLNLIKNVEEGKDDIDLIDDAIIEEEKKKSKSKKALKITGKVIGYTFLAVIIFFFGASLVSRFSNDKIVIGDSTVTVIASDSMSKKNEANSYLEANNLDNQFNTYDIIGITKYNSIDDVKLYDVISFKGDNNVTYVHRIIEITPENTYVTRGDSNNISDDGKLYNGKLTFDRIIGKYNGKRIKTLGIFVIFLQSNSGIITIVAIIYCVIMFEHFKDKYDKAVIERTNKLVELLEYNLEEDKTHDISSSFSETLIYKDNKYVFEGGKFKEKQLLEKDDKLEDLDNNELVYLSKKDNDTDITIKNVNSNEENKIHTENDSVFCKIKEFLKNKKDSKKEENNDDLTKKDREN